MSARELIKYFNTNPYIGSFQHKTKATERIKIEEKKLPPHNPYIGTFLWQAIIPQIERTRTIGTQTDFDKALAIGLKIIDAYGGEPL
jgi:hypothetical protein